MARRRNKQPRERQEDTSIRFEGLDGTSDDEYVDPLDSEPGEPSGGDQDEDPRADDPFAEQTDEPADDKIEAADDDADEREDEQDQDQEGEDEEDKPGDDVTDPGLQSLLEETRRELEETRRDRDLSRKQAAEANKHLYETRAKDVDDQLERAQADLEKSIEEGETKKQVELYNRLAELHATKRELASLKETADRQEQERPQAERQAADEPQQITAQTPAAERWMRGRNWINNPAYAQQNKDLVRMAGILVEDGYDPQQRDYYDELERRMKRRHPDLFANGQSRPQRRPDRQAVGRVSRDDPPRRGAGKQVVISREDRQNMLRFGLDPGNKDHLREYARSKLETERTTG